MDIVAFQRWVEEFYEKRSWSQYNAFIRLNFLTEEVGEVSRVVRAIEIGRDLSLIHISEPTRLQV